MSRALAWFMWSLCVVVVVSRPAIAADRVALVIGIGDYQSLSKLNNPPTDAKAIAAALRGHGFEVTEHYDLGRADLLDALEAFTAVADRATVALVYYGGHGMEIAGRNVLAPKDMEIDCEKKVPRRALDLDQLFSAVGGATQQVVLLDACRNDPFPQCPTRSAGGGSGFRGFSRVSGENQSLLIANATLSGQLAADGEAGLHSPFAAALLKRFESDQTSYLRDLLEATASDVRKLTNGSQIPEIVTRGGALRFCLDAKTCGVAAATDGDGAQVAAGAPARGDQVDVAALKQELLKQLKAELASQAAQQVASSGEGDTKVAALSPPKDAAGAPAPLMRSINGRVRLNSEKLFDGTSRGVLGISLVGLSEDWAKVVGLPSAKGAVIVKPLPGSAAERASLQPGDIVMRFGGREIVDGRSLSEAVRLAPTDAEVEFESRRLGEGLKDFVALLEARAEKDDAAAIRTLSQLHQNAFPVAGLPEDALRRHRRAADLDDPNALTALGSMYSAGIGTPKSDTEAVKLFRKAADLGNARAMFLLGLQYELGQGVAPNGAEAFALFRKSAELGDASGTSALARRYEFGASVPKDEAEARRLYRKADELGDSFGATSLGVMLLEGRGGPRDHAEAAQLFRKAANAGNAHAKARLGNLNLFGVDAPPNEAPVSKMAREMEGIRLIREAADAGDALGMTNLGWAYETGKYVGHDLSQAVKWYRAAADRGYTAAIYNLGVMHMVGRGVTADAAEGARLIRKAADLFFAPAMTRLGSCYEFGQGVPQDQTEAVNWYRRAADLGDANGIANLGGMYWGGKGVERDYNEAARLLRKSADMGFAPAMMRVGVLYELGQGVRKDLNEAATWHRKAAALGDTPAMTRLGSIYLSGKGGGDAKEGARWFRRGSDLGDSTAMLNYAWCLANGKGVQKDDEGAAHWFALSLEKGQYYAIEFTRKNPGAWGTGFRKALQRQMRDRGTYSGNVDGKFGPSTFAAMEAVIRGSAQKAAGMQ